MAPFSIQVDIKLEVYRKNIQYKEKKRNYEEKWEYF